MTTIRDLLNYLQHQLSETAVSSLSDIDLGNLENELDRHPLAASDWRGRYL